MRRFLEGAAVLTCEPGTIAAIALAVSAIGAGVSTYSSIASGESQKEAADYNAEVGRQKAKDSMQRGAIEGAAQQDKARRIAAAQAEGAAMSGVRLDTGTPLSLMTETAGLGELDKLRVINNAQREAWGYQAQSNLDEYQGKAAQRAGYLNGAGTFLGSASSAAGSYATFKGGAK
jgi:hypothetical protein